MKTKSEKMLPKTTQEITNGGLYKQAVRCGKDTCKCSEGITHSAYYFFTRRNGKLLKFYVPKSEVERISDLVQLSTLERKINRNETKESLALLKELRRALQGNQSHINSLKGAVNNGNT